MRTPFSTSILAGGKSSRLGMDKGLVSLNGKPIIGHIIEEIRKLTDDISIISSNKEYDQFNCKRYEDLYTEKGPAAGISAALLSAKHELVFITSCDMPFVKAASILSLIEQSENAEITLFKHNEFIEPMLAIYRKACFEKWDALLQQGNQKLSDFFNQFDTNFVDAQEVLKENPLLFFNINTPQELTQAAQWMTT